jgi:hypothetical protein
MIFIVGGARPAMDSKEKHLKSLMDQRKQLFF